MLPVPECYRFLSVAGPRALLVTEESVVPASNPVLTTGLPVPECCRSQSIAGYRGIGCISFKSSADNRFAGSGVLPAPECCRFRNRSAAGYRKSAVPILTGKEPSSNPVLTSGSTVTEVSARCCPNSLVAEPSPRAYRFNRLQSC